MQELKYECCFCGKGIEVSKTDPCALNIFIHFDKHKKNRKSQTFFCHLTCLKEKLHPIAQHDLNMKKSNHNCYFCNSNIITDQVNPCELDILINFNNPDKGNTFFCHLNCFKDMLHEKTKGWLALDIIFGKAPLK